MVLPFDMHGLPRLEDFPCLGVIERINKDVTQVKEGFFSVLGFSKDINGLESKKEAETTGIRKLTRENVNNHYLWSTPHHIL